MAQLINQSGNVDDIRNALWHLAIPGTKKEIFSLMLTLQSSITNERENYNRKTVISMLEQQIRKLKKAYRSL